MAVWNDLSLKAFTAGLRSGEFPNPSTRLAGVRVRVTFGGPVDVEVAVAVLSGDKVQVLRARPEFAHNQKSVRPDLKGVNDRQSR